MKKILNKWENISIKYKLFCITSGLLIALALIIYLILYYLLPSYYHKYKIESLHEEVSSLIQEAAYHDTKDLENNLYDIAKKQNLAILLSDTSGRVVYGKNEIFLFKFDKYQSKNILKLGKIAKEYTMSTHVSTNDKNTPYRLDIMMPLQPIDEASQVIRKIMPYILLVAVFVGMIGAFIYSSTVTRPLIKIIESEREQEQKRRDFIATISHELKTPITIISGQIEGMIYNIGKYKDRDTYLRKSYESTQELKELVNEMIEVSKSETLKQDLYLTNINLSNLIDNLVKRQIFLIEDKNLKTVLNIDSNIAIIADEEKITRAINNIINNAIKYSPEGETVIIRLYKRKNGRGIKTYLEVENSGITIEKKYLEEVFNPFFRIEKSRSRKTGGSGLGLYIVSTILKSHGFEYSIRNKINSVVFTIKF
ncbi:two-component sensor histidine kinase [Romboutsia ilealis]|uniref:histidine kinase n=1 Tax=Romboutsia faecis TaxID=2764597 RepID=A0ABR7JPS0_9FIRM|nr:HAMP domain-containing sensor histidine kinase [Romboutsia faecis]MBC5996899.1 two-component sensor histidine kinase [Romboutsia faecis]MRN24599.1 two-component sensor histidine kinase [Romboutsia ilealis]